MTFPCIGDEGEIPSGNFPARIEPNNPSAPTSVYFRPELTPAGGTIMSCTANSDSSVDALDLATGRTQRHSRLSS